MRLEQQLEAQQQRITALERQIAQQYNLSVADVIFMHPLRHAAQPGVRNKMEATFGVAGRAAAGYGLYRLGAWAVGKVMGG